jgi:hypothetical protein
MGLVGGVGRRLWFWGVAFVNLRKIIWANGEIRGNSLGDRVNDRVAGGVPRDALAGKLWMWVVENHASSWVATVAEVQTWQFANSGLAQM